MRNNCPARCCTFLVPFHDTRPPVMSLSGHSACQETKCPEVGHFDMSRPTSLNKVKTVVARPGICVVSTPNSLYASVRRSNPGSRMPFFFLLFLPLWLSLRSGGNGRTAGYTRGSHTRTNFLTSL